MGGWSLGDVVFILLICGLIYGILRLVNQAGSSSRRLGKDVEMPGNGEKKE